MEIQHKFSDNGGMFYIPEPDDSTTELVYRTAGPHKMIIDHTEVSEQREGHGVGKKLVAEAVAYARLHKMKVLPLCTFAKRIMEQSDDYKDLLETSN